MSAETKDETTGWKWHMWRFHHVTNGEFDCGKFSVRILGGGRPRKPWPKVLNPEDVAREDRNLGRSSVCAECLAKVEDH